MSQNLAKYHSRSPRYVLNSDDESLVRLSGPHRTPWEEGTEIRNVSLTGLAFTAHDDLCPQLGEVIKIQFTVPGGKQMACYGLVTRIDPLTRKRDMHEDIFSKSSKKLVGLHFYKLDLPQRVALAQGLTKKVKNGNFDPGLLTPSDFQIPMFEFPTLIFMASLLGVWCWLVTAFVTLDYVGLMKFFAPYVQTAFEMLSSL
ncbi:MAG: PilZ domain-containing protein [Bdellovibrionota bacterium]